MWAGLAVFGGCKPNRQLFRFVWGLRALGPTVGLVSAALDLLRVCEHSDQRLDRVWAALTFVCGLRALDPTVGPSVGSFGFVCWLRHGPAVGPKMGSFWVCLGDCKRSLQRLDLCGQL